MEGSKEMFTEMREQEQEHLKTVNATFKIQPEQINTFEENLRHWFQVMDFRIIPDTDKLYNEDHTFKKLSKAVKDAKKVRDQYINKHNYG